MKLVLALAVGVVVGLSLSPRSPQAADVERVQAMCAHLKKGAPPEPVEVAIRRLNEDIRSGNHLSGISAVGVIDARLYYLLCK